ncbi:hypothetical protein GA0115255_114647 [Streptomyces sp. Ncost-T6T-2b]|nr:hypothetical protein GA0115255_114647 [Streptomyces sp. Ncost-T6T-2b]
MCSGYCRSQAQRVGSVSRWAIEVSSVAVVSSEAMVTNMVSR